MFFMKMGAKLKIFTCITKAKQSELAIYIRSPFLFLIRIIIFAFGIKLLRRIKIIEQGKALNSFNRYLFVLCGFKI